MGQVHVLERLQWHMVDWIGLIRRDVVVIQEIEPKVHFLVLQGLYTL